MHPYCAYVATIKDASDVDKVYHDHHYGVPIHDDNELFCRLVMEINQAGLSWRTILMKEKGFRAAYNNFDIKKVAKYSDKDFDRLMNDVRIIRNRLKISAAIYNAQKLLEIQKEYGSFRKWIDVQQDVILANAVHRCLPIVGKPGIHVEDVKKLWVKEFKRNFKFVGGEIVGEFLMSIGILTGSHGEECKHYKNERC